MLRLINIGLGIDEDDDEVTDINQNLESDEKETSDVAEESIMEEVD